jgi:hypothetical protein
LLCWFNRKQKINSSPQKLQALASKEGAPRSNGVTQRALGRGEWEPQRHSGTKEHKENVSHRVKEKRRKVINY